MGRLYEYGCEFIQPDQLKALELYLEAVKDEEDVVQCALGDIYKFGRQGIPKDIVKSTFYYYDARFTNPNAAMEIGNIYAFGNEIFRKNHTLAKKYFDIAISLGIEDDLIDPKKMQILNEMERVRAEKFSLILNSGNFDLNFKF
jgi:TPR repeat protein